MNIKLITIGLLECLFSGLLTLLVVFLAYRILQRVVYGKLQPATSNPAFAVLAGSVVLSIGMLMSEAIGPAMNTFTLLTARESQYPVIALQLVKTLGIYLGIALLAALFINACGIFAYTRMTRGVDEWNEIRGQNVGVALLTGVLIIVLTLTMKHGVGMLFEAWVPYPETPRFY